VKKTLLVLGILIVFGAATAQAGFNFGVKSLSLSETQFTGYELARTSQMLGCYFGVDVSSQVVFLAGLDLSRARYKEQDTPGWVNPTDIYEFSYTSFTPHVGVKFYLKPRTSGDITPYLQAGFFKTFTSVNIGDPWDTPQEIAFEEELYKEVLSPFGFYPAFGVEYYFSDNFSLGGEMGVRFSFGTGEASWLDTDVDPPVTHTTKVNDDYFSHYVGFTLNYRFGEL